MREDYENMSLCDALISLSLSNTPISSRSDVASTEEFSNGVSAGFAIQMK